MSGDKHQPTPGESGLGKAAKKRPDEASEDQEMEQAQEQAAEERANEGGYQ